ncbi:MAG: hypothetical protein ACRCTM_09770 [Sphaerotilus sulfidivorans]
MNTKPTIDRTNKVRTAKPQQVFAAAVSDLKPEFQKTESRRKA